MLEKINHYGYSKKDYLKVADMIEDYNSKSTGIILSLYVVVMLFATLATYTSLIPHAKFGLYFSFFLAGLAYTVVLFVIKKLRTRKRIHRFLPVFVYLAIYVLVVFSIFSSIKDEFQIAVVFPAFMMICSVAFMDKMIRFSLISIISCGLMTYFSFFHKTPSIARYDMLYAIVFTFLGLLFHFRFQHARMSQFMSFYENLEIQRDLEVQSSFDTLSSLLVRGRFFSLADSVLRTRTSKDIIALCILDLDAFKQINDRYGHQMGDKAIQVAADTIWKELDADLSEKWSFCEQALNLDLSFAGRLGGDEFVIFLRESEDWDATLKKLRHILDNLNRVKMGELNGIHASFGVTKISPDDKDIDVIYARADAALYTAKTSGKNQIVEG